MIHQKEWLSLLHQYQDININQVNIINYVTKTFLLLFNIIFVKLRLYEPFAH